MDITRNDPTTSPALSYFQEAAEGVGGDPTTQLAVMLLEHAKENREFNQQQTRLEEEHLRNMQRQQVDFMRERAHHVRHAGRSKGTAMIVGGVATVAAGAAGAGENGTAKASYEGAGGIAKGLGELDAANAEKRGNDASTNSTEHEHKGDESERRLEDLREQRAHLRDLQRTALEHLESIERTEAETNQTIATWRA